MIDVKLEIAKYERGEPLYQNRNVTLLCAKDILEGNFFSRKVKYMNDDLKKATNLSEECFSVFSVSLNNLLKKEQEISESSKKASGNVRKATNDLAEGLSKLEKTANFANLEKYVLLLERAANSLTTLAELEKTGHLSKISGALK